MEFAMALSAFLCFWPGFPAPALVLRCGLNASLRFSPRAALALSALASFCGAAGALLYRGGLWAAPQAARGPTLIGSFLGGTLGRAWLLMFVARFSGSLMLARLQALPLLLLVALALLPARAPARRIQDPSAVRLGALCLFCAAADGFFGAGGPLLFARLLPPPILRSRSAPSSTALLVAMGGQAGAIALTLCAGAAQVLPPLMLLSVALGSLLGSLAAGAGQNAGRGTLSKGMRTALGVYLCFAMLALLEQAFGG